MSDRKITRTAQPQGAIGLNPALVSGAGLQDVFVAGRSVRSGATLTGSRVATAMGAGPLIPATTIPQDFGISIPENWTVVFTVKLVTTNDYYYWLMSSSGAFRGMALRHDTYSGRSIVYDGAVRDLGVLLNEGETATFAIRWDGTNYRAAKNGVLAPAVAGTALLAGTWQIRSDATDSGSAAYPGISFFNRAVGDDGMRSLSANHWQVFAPRSVPIFVGITAPSAGTATLSGTATSANETDIVTGGKTIILTLSGDTWVAAGTAFDAIRQDIIDGIDSDLSEAGGWDLQVKANQGVAGVVRTSDTVVTITLDAQAGYDITATETITATIPASAVTLAAAIVATPAFQVTYVPAGGFKAAWVPRTANFIGMGVR